MNFIYVSSLKISESNLIEIYNSVPRTLSQSAIIVSVNQESEKRSGTTNFSFQEEKGGNYWIIPIDKTTGWLFPKGGQIFDKYQYNVLIYLFACSGYEQQQNKEFILKNPAKVAYNIDQKKWSLENKGVLEFGDNSPTSRLKRALEEREKLLSDSQQDKLEIDSLCEQLQQSQNLATQSQKQLEELKRNHEKIIDLFQSQERRVQTLKSSIEQERKKSQQQQAAINDLHQIFATMPDKFESVNKKYQQLLRKDIHSTQQKLDNLTNIITNLVHEQSQRSQDIISESTKLVQESFSKTRYEKEQSNLNERRSILSTLRNSEKLEDLVKNYNQNKINKSIIVKVSATREIIEKRKTGDNTPLILTRGDEGNEAVWVVTQYPLQDNCRFLVPKLGLIINDRTYQTIEDIFICQGYKNRASNDFKLMLPAIVQLSGDEYELKEPGELIFEERGIL